MGLTAYRLTYWFPSKHSLPVQAFVYEARIVLEQSTRRIDFFGLGLVITLWVNLSSLSPIPMLRSSTNNYTDRNSDVNLRCSGTSTTVSIILQRSPDLLNPSQKLVALSKRNNFTAGQFTAEMRHSSASRSRNTIFHGSTMHWSKQ